MNKFNILPISIINKLKSIGIDDIATLNKLGAVKVFLLLRKSKMTVTNSILWKLDSVARGVSLVDIDEFRKNKLLMDVKNSPPVDLFPDIHVMKKFMNEALNEAKIALAHNEVPVGSVIVYKNTIISRAYNQTIYKNSIENHAEIIAIRKASDYLKSYRLDECDIYVTLEPCIMCAGAIINSRIRRLIFGLQDFKTGVAGSVINIFENSKLNKFTSVLFGINKTESKKLLQHFFGKLR